jgi:hypothetical protein
MGAAMTTATIEKQNTRLEPGASLTDDHNQLQVELCFDAPDEVKPKIKNPREIRLLLALLDGDKHREQLDRLIGASNSPDIVFRLRQKGFSIPCTMRPGIDRDGQPCRFGVYSLTVADRDLALRAAR